MIRELRTALHISHLNPTYYSAACYSGNCTKKGILNGFAAQNPLCTDNSSLSLLQTWALLLPVKQVQAPEPPVFVASAAAREQ